MPSGRDRAVGIAQDEFHFAHDTDSRRGVVEMGPTDDDRLKGADVLRFPLSCLRAV